MDRKTNRPAAGRVRPVLAWCARPAPARTFPNQW